MSSQVRDDRFLRTRLLLGDAALQRLSKAKVAVFGIGGVGGYVCEALVRSGVGSFDLIDNDRVSLTNLNRQIIALEETIGEYKTEVMRSRMLSINPKADICIRNCFFLPDNSDDFHFEEYDYVVDAVDTVAAKLEIIVKAKAAGTPVISAMGAGDKVDAARLRVSDVYDTRVCPLARVMRRELKKRGIDSLKVVYSDEEPAGHDADAEKRVMETETGSGSRRHIPGSTAFVPAMSGLLIAGEVVKDIIGRD